MISSIPSNLKPLVQAVEEVTGQRFHLSTVLRWANAGKLKVWRVGRRALTTPEAVAEFVEQQSERPEPTVQITTPAAASRHAKQSAAKLAARLAGKQ